MKTLAAIISIILLWGCYSKAPEKTNLTGQLLPTFKLLEADSSTYYNTSSTPSNKAVAIFYFATYCPYCLDQVNSIVEDMDQLKDIQFLFVTNAPAKDLRAYIDSHNLNKYSNIVSLMDSSAVVADYLQLRGVPYMALYTPDKKFKASYLGKVSIAQILKDTKPTL